MTFLFRINNRLIYIIVLGHFLVNLTQLRLVDLLLTAANDTDCGMVARLGTVTPKMLPGVRA